MRRVDLVTLGAMAVVVASLLVVLGCSEEKADGPDAAAQFAAGKLECMNNVRQLVGLLETATPAGYPKQSGANLLVYFVKKGEILPANLGMLFCPADAEESLDKAGGVAAYKDIDLNKQGAYGRLTSYAGRDQRDSKCVVRKGTGHAVVLICDDSEDHHDGRGFVIGVTGGAAKWRDKKDDHDVDPAMNVQVGAGSIVEELACLRAE